MNVQDIIKLAEKYGLHLKEEMSFNEMGIDFKVCCVTDSNDNKWVLRIPRRNDLAEQISKEKKILELASKYLSVEVPYWQIANSELIAYPLLSDKPVLTFDAQTYEVTWNLDKEHPGFLPSLARVLVDLHQIPIEDAEALGLKVLTPEMFRAEVFSHIEMVKQELGINRDLEARWRRWLDNDKLWPTFSTFIHGDLYAGHMLASEDGKVTGLIDWSEGQVSDCSKDFSGHVSVYGEESLKLLIKEYESLGGGVWDGMFDQVVERQSASALAYGVFAVKTGNQQHTEAAKAQLGVL